MVENNCVDHHTTLGAPLWEVLPCKAPPILQERGMHLEIPASPSRQAPQNQKVISDHILR